MSIFAKDVAISLVDDAFVFAAQGGDVPFVLPAYVAVQEGTDRILALGAEAKAMLGKTPVNIRVERVLVEGMLVELRYAVSLFKMGLRTVRGGSFGLHPRVVVSLRTAGPVRWAVKNSAIEGGAREVYLLHVTMASAIGLDLDVQQPELKAVLTVSDDWFEFSVISLAGELVSAGGPIGSRTFAEDLRNHAVCAHQISPERSVLEDRLFSLGVQPAKGVDVPGWVAWAGSAELGRLTWQNFSANDIAIGILPSLVKLSERIKEAIRLLPHEKQYELQRTTIHATGAAMGIPGLAEMLGMHIGMSVTPHVKEIHPSIEGARTVMKEIKLLRRNKG